MQEEAADFKRLEVWQLAHELTLSIYRLTRQFPPEERYRLADQLRRASSSVPANIVEGQGRFQIPDQVHFLVIARGSLQETRYFLLLSHELGYLSKEDFQSLESISTKLFAKLSAFIASKRRFAEANSAARRASSVERRARESSAFTLIELLTVISVIFLLVGLTVGVSSYMNRKGVESRAKAEIKTLEMALEAYKSDYGAYPPLDANQFNGTASGTQIITNSFPTTVAKSNGWLNIHFVYRALSGTNTPKTYMSFSSKQLGTQAVGSVIYTVILDPMGNPYGYNPVNPTGNPQSFDLFSGGVDGKTTYPTLNTTNDDLGNWQR